MSDLELRNFIHTVLKYHGYNINDFEIIFNVDDVIVVDLRTTQKRVIPRSDIK